MCGIVGVISPVVPISDNLITVMRDRLVHRGPDHGESWFSDDRRIALSHRRLSILDAHSSSNQPMSSKDGLACLIFNGEIYNYIEIKSELVKLGYTFSSQGDTEVLLYALKEWGESAIIKLNGMFAFVYLDYQEKSIIIARDRFGEKPLFIGTGEFGVKIFASEMKAITAHPNISLEIDGEAISRYTSSSWYEDDDLTFFQNIKRLPAAHLAKFNFNGEELFRKRYWTPDYTKIDSRITPREAVEEFQSKLIKSVNLRLRSDVAVGSSLSGGLDSSAVVGILADKRDHSSFEQNTFSAIFPDDHTMSEGNEIAQVVSHTGVNSFCVSPNPQLLMEESELLHWHQEEPFLSASIYLQWCVSRLAKQHQTTVLLDGQGADELLGGYQFYYKQRQLDMLDKNEFSLATRDTAKFNRRLDIASAGYEDASRRFDAGVAYSVAELSSLRNSENPVFHYPYEDGVAPAEKGYRLRRTLSEALLYNSLPMLLRYADRNSMAFSREGRLPYLDYELVDFCISLPDEYYIRNGWQKWVLREACGKSIPSSIKWRADKVGYAAPLDIWLRNEMKEWAYELVFHTRLYSIPRYNKSELLSLWNEHQKGIANNSWAIWRWLSLSQWLHMYEKGWWRTGMISKPNDQLA